MAVGQEIQVIYYSIREDMARRAKEMNSFSGYIEGTATENIGGAWIRRWKLQNTRKKKSIRFTMEK